MESHIQTLYQRIQAGSLSREEAVQALKEIEQERTAATAAGVFSGSPEPISKELADAAHRLISAMICDLLKIRAESVDGHSELSEYGFDSVSFAQLANRINDEYGLELSPALFFEQTSLNNLIGYLFNEHRAALLKRHRIMPAGAHAPEQAAVPTAAKNEGQARSSHIAPQQAGSRFQQSAGALVKGSLPHEPRAALSSEPIAVIGMSGKFPMADDLEEFWANLLSGKDCITEIPIERWDWREYYGDPATEPNKTNIKWGGFIDGVDEFDPGFFGIVPREAELMDPQQRLLMMYVWKAIEDAGYAAHSFAGTQTALIVGTSGSGYSNLVSRANIPIEGYTFSGIVPSMGPNRMSYFLDIHGPSEPVETACSSSLIAIHRAVAALDNGTCDMAIVGGVNTLITPETHIGFNKAGMLSEDGRCKTFSSAANGYVRGEGIGILVLKKLRAAEQAQDHIYGLIRATAENHGGRASSLTAPNPNAQSALLQAAYRKAGIDPRTVGYIEAHGTGTELGDPIEINGLKSAFKQLYEETGDSLVQEAHCGLGSVKTNIGHLELAAGIAGVIKVLLQLKHKTLVKSLHSDVLNPYIRLENSPFYIVRETTDWIALKDKQGNTLPRRAGVSSFGFGGANAHVVLEEYCGSGMREKEASLPTNGEVPYLFVWSARTKERLVAIGRQWLAAIRAKHFDDYALADIAYTLQTGRDAMEERLACTACTLEELEFKLEAFVQGRSDIGGIYFGRASWKHETAELFQDEDMRQVLEVWMVKGKHAQLLELWVKGVGLDWDKLYAGALPRRLSLPTYPFAKNKYWVLNYNISRPSAMAAVEPKDSDTVKKGASVTLSKSDDELLLEVAGIVAGVTGYLPAEILPDVSLVSLSNDSIVIMHIVRQIAANFQELNSPEASNELLKLFIQGEMTPRSLAAHIRDKRQEGSGAVVQPEAWDKGLLEKVYAGQKHDAQNLVCQEVAVSSPDPFTVMGTLVVDERHPFFFDHPLDHVSGLHLAEAMGQIAKTGQLLSLGLESGEPLFVSEIRLAFHDYCDKTNKAIVRAAAEPGREAGAPLAHYMAEIVQEGRIAATGTYIIMPGYAVEPIAQPEELVDIFPAEPAHPEIVNKHSPVNVLISRAESTEEKGSLKCRLCIHPENSYFNDQPGPWLDTIVLLEACRQSLRVFAHAWHEPGDKQPAGLLPVLKSMHIKLEHPIVRTADVSLESEPFETLQVGDNHILEMKGRIRVGGMEMGSYEIQSLLLTEAFFAGLQAEQQLKEQAPARKKTRRKQAQTGITTKEQAVPQN